MGTDLGAFERQTIQKKHLRRLLAKYISSQAFYKSDLEENKCLNKILILSLNSSVAGLQLGKIYRSRLQKDV